MKDKKTEVEEEQEEKEEEKEETKILSKYFFCLPLVLIIFCSHVFAH